MSVVPMVTMSIVVMSTWAKRCNFFRKSLAKSHPKLGLENLKQTKGKAGKTRGVASKTKAKPTGQTKRQPKEKHKKTKGKPLATHPNTVGKTECCGEHIRSYKKSIGICAKTVGKPWDVHCRKLEIPIENRWTTNRTHKKSQVAEPGSGIS